MRLSTVRVPDWPVLAWLAVCPPGSDVVTGYLGDHVEAADDWFCEAVWDGPFAAGDFDETDIVCGSGVRLRGDRVVFVSSGAPIDRLHSVRTPEGLFVSNSLACLLSVRGGALDVSEVGYREIFSSITQGIERYERDIPTTIGAVRQTYFDNLVWDGSDLREAEKPNAERDLATFAPYKAFLERSVTAVVANAVDPARHHPLGLTSTLSSGYDSTTTTVLAQQAGCRDAIGFDLDKSGADDSGARVAEALGLRYHEHESARAPNADVLVLAAVVGDGGDAFVTLAEEHMAGRLVFFGHWGDRIWGLEDRPLDARFMRADTSGNGLCEYRLVAGFIQCAVPFFGGRQLGDILGLSHAPELAPWDVNRPYSRPICRRIVEEAGVPRDAFGMHKRALFVGRLPRAERFLTPELRTDYVGWLRSRRLQFLRRRTVPPSPAWDALTVRLRRLPPTARRRLHRYVNHWAVDRAIERYPKPPSL